METKMLLLIHALVLGTTKAKLITGHMDVNISFGDIPAFYTFEKVTMDLNMTVNSYEGKDGVVLRFETANPRVFTIVNDISIALTRNDAYPKTVMLFIRGTALGIDKLIVKMVDQDLETVIGTLPVKVNIQPKAVRVFSQYFMMVCVIITFINMGGTIDLPCIWEKLRRPWAVLIGIVCQFLIMPPLAFGLAKALRLDASSAIGLVLDGSCPGGYLSNLLSVMLDVDYVLSLTMTFCSNILALGMMPLNLFIYTPPLTEGNKQLETPFVEIGVQLVLTFIPISIGIFCRYKSPRIRRLCTKVLKPVSSVLIVLLLATSLPFQLFIFNSPPSTYVAAILLPMCGATLGFLIAKLACLPLPSMTTIALETGVQNALLAMTIITFFYPHPESELASRTPALILLMTIMEGVALVIVYNIVKKLIGKTADEDLSFIKEDGEEEKKGQIEKSSKAKSDVAGREINANEIVYKENVVAELGQGCQTEFIDDSSYTNAGFQHT